jgi:predicted metal-dependent hydrolase
MANLNKPKVGELPSQTANLGGTPITYTVRISATATRGRIKASAAGIEVVMPRALPVAAANAFVLEHAAWILKQLERQQQRRDQQQARRLPPGTLLLRGQPAKVRYLPAAKGHRRGSVDPVGDQINIYLPAPGVGDPNRVLEGWLREEARRDITDSVRIRAALMMVQPNGISIKDQRTRWGSCSSKRNLSFNWRLIMAPPAVLDYIVVHELAHLIEMNHSARFWRIVRAHCVDFELHRAWLKADAWLLRAPLL